jgi:hypothetical protein
LALRLEFGVLAALGTMHHTLDIKHVGEVFVGIQRRVDWLEGLDGAGTIYMLTLL